MFAPTMDNSWTELHVGIRMHHELHGMIFSDYRDGQICVPRLRDHASSIHQALGRAHATWDQPFYQPCTVLGSASPSSARIAPVRAASAPTARTSSETQRSTALASWRPCKVTPDSRLRGSARSRYPGSA